MHIIVRLFQVNAALWGFLIWFILVRARLIRSSLSPADRFSRTLERLGATFVKLGQGLGLHRELLPDDYVAALQKLQDHVEAFPGDVAVTEIEQSFNRPITELFAQFEHEPFAAGSIAQVHRATMHDGRKVIVKVRRPGIKRQVDEDIRILKWFLKTATSLLPGLRRLRPLDLVDELSRNLHREIDFRQEAANISRFSKMFRESTSVYVPTVTDGLYSDWVLVQEMSMGLRIDDPAILPDGPRLAKNLVEAFLHQFFVAGVFHGDPHPGNLFVLDDGRICFHDFGLVGFLDRGTRTNLVAFMQAFVQQDGEWLLDTYLELGILGGAPNQVEFRAGLEEIIQDYSCKPLKDWSFGEAFLRIARIGHGQNIRLPQHLLVLMRAVFLMESTVRKLDPEFNLREGLFAKAPETLKSITGPVDAEQLTARLKYETLLSLRDLPTCLSRTLRRLRSEGLELTVNHHGLDRLGQEIHTVSTRVSLALVTLGLYIAASLLMQHSIGPKWGDTPILAIGGYVLALWNTWRLSRMERGKH